MNPLLGGFHAVKGILALLLVYNLMCVIVFSTLYYTFDIRKHFVTPDGFQGTYLDCMYYAFAVQSTCMAGEVYPRTALGRALLSFQLLSAFLATMVLIVPWIKATSKA